MATNFLGLIGKAFPRLIPGRRSGPSTRRGVRILNDFHNFDNAYERPDVEAFLGIPAVWLAVRLICESGASLPLKLYRHNPKTNGREKLSSHPVARIFKKPNDRNTEIEFREFLYYSAIVHGRGYAEIIRNERTGLPEALIPIPAGEIRETEDAYGYRRYEVTGEDGRRYSLSPADLLILSSFMGKGLVDLCSDSLVLCKAAETYSTQVFENGARPGGIITTPVKLSREAKVRLRDDWDSVHRGSGKAFKTAVLEEGYKFDPVNGTSSDAQAIEMREFQIKEVCRIFGIPLSKMKVDGAATASTEQENIAFLQDTLRPWLIRFEEMVNKTLLSTPEQSDTYWEHSVDALLRADFVNRFKGYSIAKNWGILNSDEIRELENRPAIPNGAGKSFLSPVNMQPLVEDLGAPGARAPTTDSPSALLLGEDDDPTPADLLPAQVDGDPSGSGSVPLKTAEQTPAAGTPDVQSTALNGAQIASLVELVNQVGQGLIPAESAKAIAVASFPFLSSTVIDSIFNPVKVRPQPAAVSQPEAVQDGQGTPSN